MISTIEKGFIATPFGPVLADRLAMKAAVVDRFLIRLTKGLLTKFYPELDYSDFRFEITMFDQLKLLQTLESISVLFVKDQRGGDTFRFWRGLAADKPTYGVWIYSFYEGVTFMVSHDVPG